jgi:hypothetical protein
MFRMHDCPSRSVPHEKELKLFSSPTESIVFHLMLTFELVSRRSVANTLDFEPVIKGETCLVNGLRSPSLDRAIEALLKRRVSSRPTFRYVKVTMSLLSPAVRGRLEARSSGFCNTIPSSPSGQR